MNNGEYVKMYVAVQRLRRQASRADADFQRWLDRISLAQRAAEPELAHTARRMALVAGELSATLHGNLASQEERLAHLEWSLGVS